MEANQKKTYSSEILWDKIVGTDYSAMLFSIKQNKQKKIFYFLFFKGQYTDAEF